jgi:hypothetical protein
MQQMCSSGMWLRMAWRPLKKNLLVFHGFRGFLTLLIFLAHLVYLPNPTSDPPNKGGAEIEQLQGVFKATKTAGLAERCCKERVGRLRNTDDGIDIQHRV